MLPEQIITSYQRGERAQPRTEINNDWRTHHLTDLVHVYISAILLSFQKNGHLPNGIHEIDASMMVDSFFGIASAALARSSDKATLNEFGSFPEYGTDTLGTTDQEASNFLISKVQQLLSLMEKSDTVSVGNQHDTMCSCTGIGKHCLARPMIEKVMTLDLLNAIQRCYPLTKVRVVINGKELSNLDYIDTFDVETIDSIILFIPTDILQTIVFKLAEFEVREKLREIQNIYECYSADSTTFMIGDLLANGKKDQALATYIELCIGSTDSLKIHNHFGETDRLLKSNGFTRAHDCLRNGDIDALKVLFQSRISFIGEEDGEVLD
jgi:hypothetical protein